MYTDNRYQQELNKRSTFTETNCLLFKMNNGIPGNDTMELNARSYLQGRKQKNSWDILEQVLSRESVNFNNLTNLHQKTTLSNCILEYFIVHNV